MRAHAVVHRIAWVLSIGGLGLAPAAGAVLVRLDYDSVPLGDFRTAPYYEGGVTTTVNCGHYEAHADATSTTEGDRAFNLDEQPNPAGPPPGQQCDAECPTCAKVTITAQGFPFDALGLDVINPADSSGEYTISAVDGGGSTVATVAPIEPGTLEFGPAFEGITALVITQHAAGSFTFDELEIESLPEPPAIASRLVAGLAVLALRRRVR